MLKFLIAVGVIWAYSL